MKKTKAYLFGPFYGELSWEYFRFAPYTIHLKKNDPSKKIIVLTRGSRFDLYGCYADILIPLNIPKDDVIHQKGFKLITQNTTFVDKTIEFFRNKYKTNYRIVDHFVPDTSPLRYNLKWQFPRNEMDYDFNPRKGNLSLLMYHINDNMILIDKGFKCANKNYHVVNLEGLSDQLIDFIDNKSTTYIGCLIEMIKKSKFVVSTLKSDVGRLALLLKTPLIYPKRDVSDDTVHLLNPLKTKIIDCDTVSKGIKKYESNI